MVRYRVVSDSVLIGWGTEFQSSEAANGQLVEYLLMVTAGSVKKNGIGANVTSSRTLEYRLNLCLFQ